MNFESNVLMGITLILATTGCGGRSAGTPTATPAIREAESQSVASPDDQIVVEKMASAVLPIDLAANPTFVTEGFVIASETYTNLNDHPIRLTPSQEGTSLVLQSQIRNVIGTSQNSSSASIPVVLSVTAKQDEAIEQVRNSISGSGIDLAAGEKITLNWRISPAPGLPLCKNQLKTGFAGIQTSPEGTQLAGQLVRSVGFVDDTNNAQGNLIQENYRESLVTGAVNTTPNSYGSGNCVGVSL